jgi:MFS family permease
VTSVFPYALRRTLRADVSVLLVSTLVLALGNGLLLTLVPVRAELAGVSTSVSALLTTAYFLGLIVGSLRCFALVRAVGPIRTFAGLAAVLAATALVFPMTAHPMIWIVSRAVGGFCVAGLFVVVEGWLNTTVESGQRGTLLATYSVVLYFALAVGQILLLTGSAQGSELFSLAAILLGCSVLPLSLSRVTDPDAARPEIIGLGRVWALAPLGLVGCFTSGLLVGPLLGLAPIWAMQPEQSAVGVSGIMTAAILGGLATQLPVGWVSDRVDRRWVLVAILFAFGVCAMSLGLAGELSRPWLLAGAASVGGLVFLVYPLSLALANDRLSPQQMVAAAGSLMLTYASGAALSPMVVGVLMDRFGARALFPAEAGIAWLACAYALVRVRTAPSVPPEEQGGFVPAGATAATSALVTEALDESSGGPRQDRPLRPCYRTTRRES